MATILAYTSPAFGNLYPIIALLIELQRRGHRIVLRTFADGVSTGRELGFESSAIDPRIEATVMTDWTAPNNRAALKVAFGVFAERAAYEVEECAGPSSPSDPTRSLSTRTVGGQRRWRTPVAAPVRALGVVLAVHTIPAIARRAAVRARSAPLARPPRSAAR